MNGPRFFVAEPLVAWPRDSDVALPAAVAVHAARALRLQPGDAIVLFDGRGGEYAATLSRIDKRGAFARIGQHDAVERESPLDVTLAQALIASEAMDYAVRRAVELGVARIVPLLTERSQRARSDDRAEKRRSHWQAIAIAACEQCGRNRVPTIAAPVTLETFIDEARRSGSVAIAAPVADRTLAELARRDPPRTLVIGPEGGFSEAELRHAANRGAQLVSLGPRVLRADTAALAALATLAAIAGDAR